MKSPRSGDLTASMAVMGLVIQQPDTAAGIALRLEEQFPNARFADNAAHNNLPVLAKEGYVLLVKKGERQSLDLYEAAPKGAAFVQTWVRESDAAPLGWRDALRGKLAFAEYEGILEVLQEIREQEEVCTLEYAIAHRRVSIKRAQERRGAKPLDFKAGLIDVLDADEATLWGLRAMRLKRLGEEIEGLLEEMRASRSGVSDG